MLTSLVEEGTVAESDLLALNHKDEWAVADAGKKFKGGSLTAAVKVRSAVSDDQHVAFSVFGDFADALKTNVLPDFTMPWDDGLNFRDVKEGTVLTMTGVVDAIQLNPTAS